MGFCDITELNCINSGVSSDELKNNNNIIGKNKDNTKNKNNDTIFSNLCDKDIDDNIPDLTNCKYYTVSEFHNSIDSNNFNIFHINVNGLETKFESLHHFLSSASTKFDIIAITETSQKTINEEFYTNINLEGYINFSTPTNTNKKRLVAQEYMT